MAQRVFCSIYFEEEGGIVMERSGASFYLGYDKILDMLVRNDLNVQTSYVSSAGGAVAGNELFGPIGGLIGGRVRGIRNSTLTYYLVIEYNHNGMLSYLTFHLPEEKDWKKAEKLIKRFSGKFCGEKVRVKL